MENWNALTDYSVEQAVRLRRLEQKLIRRIIALFKPPCFLKKTGRLFLSSASIKRKAAGKSGRRERTRCPKRERKCFLKEE